MSDMNIQTPDDWWTLFDSYKEELRNIVLNYHPSHLPSQSFEPFEFDIQPEKACKVVRAKIKEEEFESNSEIPSVRFDKAVESKDWQTLVSLMNSAWFGIPENLDCWEIPGFGSLCDLCSECWVFETEEQNAF